MSSDPIRAARAARRAAAHPTPVRIAELDRQIEAARRRQYRLEYSAQRIVDGTALWPDFLVVTQPAAEEGLVQALPSLAVRRVRRRLGLSPGPIVDLAGDVIDDALETLAHRPEDTISDELLAKQEGWRTTLDDPESSCIAKQHAASAILMVGPDGGTARRAYLWASGQIETRGGEQMHREAWHNQRALDWSVLDRVLSEDPEVEGWPEPGGDTFIVGTYHQMIELVNVRVRPRIRLRRGHARPTAATPA